MKITPPKITALLFEADPVLSDEVALEGCRLSSVNLRGRKARAVSLDEAVLEKVVLAEAKFEKLAGQDVVIKDCDFAAAQCAGLSLLRASVSNTRMTGVDCSRGLFKDVTFSGCKLDLTNFRFAKFQRVKFSDCILTDTDFLNVTLVDVAFEDCVLERTDFTQCTTKNIDLRSSQLLAIRGWASMKGVTIDGAQLAAVAPELAGELGIIIAD